MRRIQCLKDLKNLVDEIPNEFLQYLNSQFNCLYEYLSNGEELDNFILGKYQNMVILEGDDEIKKFSLNTLDLEFIEEVKLNQITIIRIGLNCDEDIQLHYAIKGGT
ncbi:hypothetical protein [Metabacillus litoralis]|uniref:Uncharacterized protein n=1 Tax=Metabacillus litoralis TaxID=152268 RepID=A0A179SQ12_9BACI|nr:hypothetical protein [Metabacillus litoralis]OAS83100.1 hypothetical protein A6K24_10780 [Metabacillus litoralis]